MQAPQIGNRDRLRLGGARADFVASLGKKVEDARGLLRKLEAEPASDTLRDELHRKLHALGAGARLLRFEVMERAIAEALSLLERASHEGDLSEGDLAGVGRVLEELPKLAWGESPRRDQSQEPPPVEEAGPAYTALVVGGPRVAEALRARDPDGLRFECESTPDAQTAFDVAQALCPDLIVVDADVRDALELVGALMDDPIMDQVPVLVIGSFSVSGSASQYVALGVTKTLGKPISHQTLRRACEDAIFAREGRTMKLVLGEPTVAELGERLAEEVRHALVDGLEEAARLQRIPVGEGTEVLGAVWGAIARVREVITSRTHGAVRFDTIGPEGAICVAPSLEVEPSGDQRGTAKARGAAADVSLEGRGVVVADDDPGVAWFIADLLRGAGCVVHEALDGDHALRLAYQTTPDLVIADILMPKLDGFALTRTLKRDVVLRDAPVVLLSWKEDLLQRVRELNVGASGYLRKESDGRAVLARLREALRPRSRIETRLRASGEVRGRLDGITVRTLLAIVCRARKNARLSVRDASFLYEVEIRDGAPVRASRTAGDGGFASGPRVLAAMLGVGAGRFIVADASAPVQADLVGDLGQQLARPVAVARAGMKLVAGGAALGLAKLDLDPEALADYLRATPERGRLLLEAVAAGRAPKEVVAGGFHEAALLEDLLLDLAARGAVVGATDEAGQDAYAPLLEQSLGLLDARARGLIGMTPSALPPATVDAASAEPAPVASAPVESPDAPVLELPISPTPTDIDAAPVRAMTPAIPIDVASVPLAPIREERAEATAPPKKAEAKPQKPAVDDGTDEDGLPRIEETPLASVAVSAGVDKTPPKTSRWPLVVLAILVAAGVWALVSYGSAATRAQERAPEPPPATVALDADPSIVYSDIPSVIALEPGQGVVEVVAPEGMLVMIDGVARPEGKTRVALGAGVHDVRLVGPSQRSRLVEVRPGLLARVDLAR